jgi:acetylornithine deacetylase/succinyl-diaminopimelate desuccinylase-like protein
MKNMDAMIIATVREWARTGYVPERDIVLAFFADEEAGSNFGSHYMVKNHPDVFEGCTEAVSEVGGFSVTVAGGKRLYLIETAEKGIHWMRLTAEGRAGHGSMMNEENAVTRLAEAVAKIGAYTWPQRYSKTVKAFFKRIADETNKPYNEEDLRPLLNEIGFAATMIGATLQNTANPTMLEAGYKANVIPGSASAVVDGRFIPGFEDELNETIKSLIGEHVTVETITRDKALEVPFEGDLVEAMCNALVKEDSVAIPVPYVMSGGTDNKALADLGIIGYGFSPLKLDADFNFMAMFHGVDERVPVEGLTFGVRVLKEFLENS